MEFLSRQLVGFDDYLSGHLNTLIGYLGILVAGRYMRRFIAYRKNISEDKVFVFANLSGAPSPMGNIAYNEWRALGKNWWRYGSIRIVPRYTTLKELTFKEKFNYDVKVGASGSMQEEKSPVPVEEKLRNLVKRLGHVPAVDIIAIYCPYFERLDEEDSVCRACKFYAKYGNKCPYSRDLGIVFMEVKSTRGKGEYEITKSQKETLNYLKEINYEVYLVVVKFKGSIQKPLAVIDIYAV